MRRASPGTRRSSSPGPAIATLGAEAVTGYRIEESETRTGTWTELVADTGNTDTNTTYRRTGLIRDDVRYYRVRALSASNTSEFSARVGAGTRPSAPAKPVATLTALRDGSYILSWPYVTSNRRGADDYEFRIPGARGVWRERPSVRSDGHRYISVSGPEDVVADVRVRAVILGRRLPGGADEGIAGPWSDEATIADDSLDIPPNPFTGLIIGTRSHDGIRPFSLELQFNRAPEPLNGRTVREALLEVSGGTVTDARRVTPGSDRRWRITVQPAGAGDVRVELPAGSQPCTDEATVCAGTERLVETVSHVVRGSGAVLSASFAAVPASHDGETPFTVKLTFSEEPALSYKTVRDSLLEVSGATVTGASRVTQGSDREWTVTVEPSQGYVITLTLPARACGETGAVCVDDRPLADPASATIPGAPLTATLTGPAEHDGSTSFTVRLTFSMEPDVSYKTVLGTMFTVKGGTIEKAGRVDPPADLEFDITVEPDGDGAVSLSLASPLPACGETGAVCTAAGRKIEGTVNATIPGPVAISVADATVREAAGAALAFAVTLDRAPSEPVTVDYATSGGTGAGAATEGADYTATSGTLTFAPGDTEQTVSVPVLADDHDEGAETMTLTLTNPAGARIADGTATGTIENTGPIPKAWIARFGRTVADQVLDAVGERMRGGSAASTRLTLGGHEVLVAADWPNEGEALDGAGDFMRVGADELLLASSFHLASAAGTEDAPRWSLWGRGARSSFSGRDGELTLDGDVLTGLVGADYESGKALLGVALAWSAGDGSYKGAGGRGELESKLASLYPYLRYTLSERLSVWGAVGMGEGNLTLQTPTGEKMETGLSLAMAALGVRGALLSGAGYELAVKSDLTLVHTESEETTGLASAEAQTRRLRLVLEGSREVNFGGASLTPSVQVGMRYDGGDAETGVGVELGGGVRFAASGLTMEVRGRGLLAHEDRDY